MDYIEFFDKYQIPSRYQEKLEDISPEDKERILEVIERDEKTVHHAILYEIFGFASSGYLGNWFLQFLVWLYTLIMLGLTLDGNIVMGIFWAATIAYRFVSIPRRVKDYNRRLFRKLLRRVIDNKLSKPFSFSANPQKKRLKVAYDPTEITVYNLQKGFLLDYMQSTWQVIEEGQYQWKGCEEKYFVIENDRQRKYLFFDYSPTPNTQNPITVFDQLDSSSLNRYYVVIDGVQTPMSQINIGNQWMNETRFQKGYFYAKYVQEGQILKCWRYTNDTHDRFLRIEKYRDKRQELKIYLGIQVESYLFTEILPAAN